MRVYLVVAPCLLLHGCFVYLPGGLFARGDSCVSEKYVVGDKIRNVQTGRWGTITELHGRSDRCQSGDRPILASVKND